VLSSTFKHFGFGGYYLGTKNWHQTSEKTDLITTYSKELKGSTNADLYFDKKTGKTYLIGNKSGAIVEIK